MGTGQVWGTVPKPMFLTCQPIAKNHATFVKEPQPQPPPPQQQQPRPLFLAIGMQKKNFRTWTWLVNFQVQRQIQILGGIIRKNEYTKKVTLFNFELNGGIMAPNYLFCEECDDF